MLNTGASHLYYVRALLPKPSLNCIIRRIDLKKGSFHFIDTTSVRVYAIKGLNVPSRKLATVENYLPAANN